MKSKRLNFLVFGVLAFILFSCAEKQEGCLDVYATNFEFEADKVCEDCCTYPVFELAVSHYWDSLETFSYSDPVFEQQDSTDTIWINQLGFFISDIRFHTDTDSLGMFSLIEVPNTFGDNLVLESSISWINQKDPAGKDLGILLQRGETIDSVSFWIGFNPNYGVPDASNLPSSNPVSYEPDSLNYSEDYGLLYAFLNYNITGSLPKDSTGIELLNAHYVKLNLDFDAKFNVGEDVSLDLRLYYSKLIDGCSLQMSNTEQIRICLEENFTNSFKAVSLD